MGLRAVGEHGPDLAGAAASRFEDDVTAVGRPTGAFVAAGVASDFEEAAGGGFHDVDVVIAAGAAPTESEHLAVGGPGGIDDVAHVGKIVSLDAGAVGIHGVNLRNAAAVADEGDGLAGFGIEGSGHIGTVRSGEPLGVAAV